MITNKFFEDSLAVAEYVEDLTEVLKHGSVLTMIIRREKSAGYCVNIATVTSSEDIRVNTQTGTPEQVSMFDKGQGFSYLSEAPLNEKDPDAGRTVDANGQVIDMYHRDPGDENDYRHDVYTSPDWRDIGPGSKNG